MWLQANKTKGKSGELRVGSGWKLKRYISTKKNDTKRIARCQKIILVPKADTIENVVIFCTFGAWITGNYLEDTQLGVKHLL